MKILAVDDSPALLELLADCLREFGHDVTVSQNGALAAKQLEAKTFDLIVSDLNMVVAGGLELLTAVRKHTTHEACPFVLLTTELDPAQKSKARKLGATAWMNKPFDPETLRSLISQFEPV